MKKSLFTALLLLIAGTASMPAQNNHSQQNDTINVNVIEEPAKVKISTGNNSMKVEVTMSDGRIHTQQKQWSSDVLSIINEENSRWNINIPFVDKKQTSGSKQKSKNYKRAYFEFGILDDFEFGMGLVTATDQPSPMDVNLGNAGWELYMNNIFGWSYRPFNCTELSLGFGLDWRNYRMKDDYRFVKEGASVTVAPYPDGADIDFSRIKVFSITLELMLNQRLFGNVWLSAGGVVNFNTHSSVKTRYSVPEGEGMKPIKETGNNIGQRPVTFDLKAQLDIDPIAFYVKYSPTTVLQKNKGPQFHSLSVGVAIRPFDFF